MQSFFASREIRRLVLVAVLVSGYLLVSDALRDIGTLAVFAVLSLAYLFEPYRVDVTDTGKVRFHRTVGTREYDTRDIVRITEEWDCYAIVFPSRTIRLSPFLDKMPALKAALMEHHPDIGLADQLSEPGYAKKAGIWTALLLVLFAVFLIVKFLFFFPA